MRGLLLAFLLLAAPALAQPISAKYGPGDCPFNASSCVSKSTGSTTARSAANRWADTANVRDFGADSTGVADSTSAFTAAAAALNGVYRDLYLPAGNYRLTNMVTLTNGQCLHGDAKSLSTITVGSDFNSSATSVLSLTSNQDSGPCVHDVTISFALPTDATTTTTKSEVATATTITVASTSNILVGGSVVDSTTGAGIGIPSLTTVVSVVGNVVTLSAPITGSGVGNGDTIRFGAARGTFATLAAGCTTGLGGTGCKYPPAIQPVSAATRIQLYRLKIQGAWDGISTALNNVMWLDNIEMSAFNKGLAWDNTVSSGTQDFGHIHGYHFWDFGFNSSTNLYNNVFTDGSTVAAAFGEVDGINVLDFSVFVGRVQLTSNFTWGQFTNVGLDTGATFEVAGTVGQIGLAMTNVYTSGVALGSNTHCMVDIAGGTVSIVNLRQPTSTTTGLCVSGGTVSVTGGLQNPNTTTGGSIVQTGGVLSVTGVQWAVNTGAGAWTTPLVNVTAGTITFTGNSFNASTGGTALAITSDNALNLVQNNEFNTWVFDPPGSLGVYTPRPSYLAVHRAAAQTITAGSNTKIAWDVVDADNRSWWNFGSSRYVPQLAGRYLVSFTALVGISAPIANQTVNMWVLKNATTASIQAAYGYPGLTQMYGMLSGNAVVSMNGTTDYLEVFALTTAGGGNGTILAANVNGYFATMNIQYLGP